MVNFWQFVFIEIVIYVLEFFCFLYFTNFYKDF